jgi:hypothetical protein
MVSPESDGCGLVGGDGRRTARRTESLDQLGQLAATAAGRLAGADLALQSEVLGLLDVKVTVLDGSRTPALRVTRTLLGNARSDLVSLTCLPGSRG